MFLPYTLEGIFKTFLLVLFLISFFTHIIRAFSSKASKQIMDNSRETLVHKLYHFILPTFETVTMERMSEIRCNIANSNEIEIKNLKVGVNSELDRIKHFAPMAVIITLLITAFLAIFSSVVPAANSWTNNILSQAINIKISELENEGKSKSEITDSLLNSEEFGVAPEFGEQVSIVIDKMVRDTLGINFQMFLFLAILLGLYWIIHQFRLSKLLKLKYILDEHKFSDFE
ncbi:hypothetical protein GLV94_03035 [Virgibacillus halodenitrificans]|uniref:hypothetical protein n=1 Tax=Virgibacillus halodenitrificans TaxID=1482 RepID=UPI001370C67F|nr:hypothetical protein [Virgibacillus halodenitrificans]MYL44608.1 hypothetical protein [Virgibacillus halodenitrificans]